MATIRIHRGKWQAIVRRKGFPQKSKSFVIKAHAVRWARQTEIDLDTGRLRDDHHILEETQVADLIARYRDTVTVGKRGRLSESTRLNSFIREPWAKETLSKTSSGTFSRYRDIRLAKVRPASVRRDLGLLRSIFQVAIDERDIPPSRNPLASVARPKEPEARRRRLERSEMDLLLHASKAHAASWQKFGILLALETGMRRGELLSVRWADVDKVKSTLTIKVSKNGLSRSIPLSCSALKTLNFMRTEHCQDSDLLLDVTANAFRRLGSDASVELRESTRKSCHCGFTNYGTRR